jgi:hypothetical protein
MTSIITQPNRARFKAVGRKVVSAKHLLVFFLFFLPNIAFSQKVFSVDYANQSDLKVYVVEYENQCDLKVHKVKYSNQVDGNKGLWYFVDYSNQADKKIYFVDYANQSDLKIYFVKYKNQAGWRNKSKQHLLY